MFKKVIVRWKQYRYRFVPWIALNLKNRNVRSVQKLESDQVISDDEAEAQLLQFLVAIDTDGVGSPSSNTADKNPSYSHNSGLEVEPCSKCGTDLNENVSGTDFNESLTDRNSGELKNNKEDFVNAKVINGARQMSTSIKSKYVLKALDVRWDQAEEVHRKNLSMNYAAVAKMNLDIMFDELGYVIERTESDIVGGGRGVKVTRGRVPKHRIVAMYPGTLYYPSEPVFFQSLGNPFIFRCIDRLLIDGNDKAISKIIYRSCLNRDRIGPYLLCDQTWLTTNTINPLAVGQYVNNQTSGHPANVAYQEYDLPRDFPFPLRKYIPNIYYSPSTPEQPNSSTRTVLLVSLRDIEEGEELLSAYFTMVH